MKYAVIADIHANLEALEVVLDDTKAQKCTHYCCVGDVVGYNANPKECLDIVRQMGMPVFKDNHDEYCSTEEDLEGHSFSLDDWDRAFAEVSSKYDSESVKKRDLDLKKFVKKHSGQAIGMTANITDQRRVFPQAIHERVAAAALAAVAKSEQVSLRAEGQTKLQA